MIKIFIDGGARGNPGPAAIGCVIINPHKNHKKEYGLAIGKATNNEAEYQALIFALKKAKNLYGKNHLKEKGIEILSDSTILVKQMQGKYQIKEPKLQLLFIEAWNLRVEIGNIRFKHISRSENKRADEILNKTLDAITRNQKLF